MEHLGIDLSRRKPCNITVDMKRFVEIIFFLLTWSSRRVFVEVTFFHRCLLFGWMVVWLSSLGQLCPTWNSSQAEKRLTSSTPKNMAGNGKRQTRWFNPWPFWLYLTFPKWSRFHHLRILIIPLKGHKLRRITRFAKPILGIIQLSQPSPGPPWVSKRQFSESGHGSPHAQRSRGEWQWESPSRGHEDFWMPSCFSGGLEVRALLNEPLEVFFSTKTNVGGSSFNFKRKSLATSELDHIGNLWGAETRNLLAITNWSARMPDATGFIYQRWWVLRNRSEWSFMASLKRWPFWDGENVTRTQRLLVTSNNR